MTDVSESALWIDCEGSAMLGVLAQPARPQLRSEVGVLIVVGGPQYRVGSHRQFTLLARRLAAAGYPTMRFDYRGMGDSTGNRRVFTEVESDIAAAAAALQERAQVSKLVLWGLCDAASAVLLGLASSPVAGLVLVNPWVRSDASLSATRLKHYYTGRLWDADFWKKLLTGRIDWNDSVRSLAHTVHGASRRRPFLERTSGQRAVSFQERMAHGLRTFDHPVLLALSGNDLTAKEFVDHTSGDASWQGLLDRDRITKVALEEADHTFSKSEWRSWLEEKTLEWLRSHFEQCRAG
jgi:exosortase A-associated hydrolase 1